MLFVKPRRELITCLSTAEEAGTMPKWLKLTYTSYVLYRGPCWHREVQPYESVIPDFLTAETTDSESMTCLSKKCFLVDWTIKHKEGTIPWLSSSMHPHATPSQSIYLVVAKLTIQLQLKLCTPTNTAYTTTERNITNFCTENKNLHEARARHETGARLSILRDCASTVPPGEETTSKTLLGGKWLVKTQIKKTDKQ